jgi:hypothetical protein
VPDQRSRTQDEQVVTADAERDISDALREQDAARVVGDSVAAGGAAGLVVAGANWLILRLRRLSRRRRAARRRN